MKMILVSIEMVSLAEFLKTKNSFSLNQIYHVIRMQVSQNNTLSTS